MLPRCSDQVTMAPGDGAVGSISLQLLVADEQALVLADADDVAVAELTLLLAAGKLYHFLSVAHHSLLTVAMLAVVVDYLTD